MKIKFDVGNNNIQIAKDPNTTQIQMGWTPFIVFTALFVTVILSIGYIVLK